MMIIASEIINGSVEVMFCSSLKQMFTSSLDIKATMNIVNK
jgi:hypothetical protein